MMTSSMVLILVVSSNIFGAVFTKLGATDLITSGLLQLPLPDVGKLLLIMVLIFVLGWPFEWPAIILVFLPIFMPVVETLNFGLSNGNADVVRCFGGGEPADRISQPAGCDVGLLLKNVMPQWSLGTIYRGMGEFMVIQLLCLAVIVVWPDVVLWLPRMLK